MREKIKRRYEKMNHTFWNIVANSMIIPAELMNLVMFEKIDKILRKIVVAQVSTCETKYKGYEKIIDSKTKEEYEVITDNIKFILDYQRKESEELKNNLQSAFNECIEVLDLFERLLEPSTHLKALKDIIELFKKYYKLFNEMEETSTLGIELIERSKKDINEYIARLLILYEQEIDEQNVLESV